MLKNVLEGSRTGGSAHHGTHQDMRQIKETVPLLLSSCQLLLTVLTHLEISTLMSPIGSSEQPTKPKNI